MNFDKSKDFGCIKSGGVSDMTETNGTLTEQLDKAQIK